MVINAALQQNWQVIIVCQKGAVIDAGIKYGAARAMLELAGYLVSLGRKVLLVGVSDQKEGELDGIPFIGCQDEIHVLRTLKSISPIKTLIGISRADIFVGIPVAKSIIYHHGSHRPQGDFAIQIIRSQKIQMVVVSMDSIETQQKYGIPREQIHLVYNGYNSQDFLLNSKKPRAQHRIVFAGNGVPYKGLDIAVQALALLLNSFPNAELHIFGDTREWLDKSVNHFWPVDWLDKRGSPIWTKIEHALPGVKYFGEVGQTQLASAFQTASLLVMPSRVKETFGIVSLESQACGCIPVLPRQGGFPETMQEGITGYLYDNNTPEGLATFIGDLWTRNLPSEEQRLIAANWVKQEFSWQKTGQQFVAAMDRMPHKTPLSSLATGIFWKLMIGVKLPALLRSIKAPVRFLKRLLS